MEKIKFNTSFKFIALLSALLITACGDNHDHADKNKNSQTPTHINQSFDAPENQFGSTSKNTGK